MECTVISIWHFYFLFRLQLRNTPTILKSSIYVDAPFLNVFVKFVVYLLFQPENISSKVDVIENAN